MIKSIRKRDGRVVDYDISKIENAKFKMKAIRMFFSDFTISLLSMRYVNYGIT